MALYEGHRDHWSYMRGFALLLGNLEDMKIIKTDIFILIFIELN